MTSKRWNSHANSSRPAGKQPSTYHADDLQVDGIANATAPRPLTIAALRDLISLATAGRLRYDEKRPRLTIGGLTRAGAASTSRCGCWDRSAEPNSWFPRAASPHALARSCRRRKTDTNTRKRSSLRGLRL